MFLYLQHFIKYAPMEVLKLGGYVFHSTIQERGLAAPLNRDIPDIQPGRATVDGEPASDDCRGSCFASRSTDSLQQPPRVQMKMS